MQSPDRRTFRIVFASHTVMGSAFVVGSHHLARQCAARGHRVLHLSTPITPFHLLRVGADEAVRVRFRAWLWGNRRDASGVTEAVALTPLPWAIARHVFRSTGVNPTLWTMPGLRRTLERSGTTRPDVLICDQPTFVGLQRRVGARTVIYRATDDYAAMRGDRTLDLAERALLARAHGVIATARPLMDRLRDAAPDKPTLLLENGVEHGHFATPRDPPEEYRAMARPRAVYVGALDDRFDTGAVRLLADGAPRLNVILIGPASPKLRARFAGWSNVFLLGPRRYGDLPPYLQHADIALLPLSGHPSNDARSPMKLYEYRAAGLAVLARATSELTRRGDPHLRFYRDNADILPVATALLAEVERQGPDRRRAISNDARRFDWGRKADELLEFVAALSASDRPDRECEIPRVADTVC